MTIALPTSPRPQKASISPVLFGGPMLAELGGEDQWVNRTGSRWQLDVLTPQLRPQPDSRIWTECMTRAWFTGERVSFPVPQPGLNIGNPGAPVINGSGQTGSSIALRGFSAFYQIWRGQFLSIISGGRRYLHRVRTDLDSFNANGAGLATFGIDPMIRVSPTDGDAVEFLNPLIEGLLIGDNRGWTYARARTDGLSFTIRETR